MPPLYSMYQRFIYFIASGFGCGLAPKAPGTVGTLIAIPLYLLMQNLPIFQYLIIVIVAILIGIPICHQAAKTLQSHDHPSIVWDEFCGYWVTMIAAPKGVIWIIIGFILFRLFDIWKPNPIGYIDKKIGGGLGIMLDDILAGLFALTIIQFLSIIISLTLA